MNYEQQLVEQLDLIDRVVRSIGRRHRLSPSDVEELASLVRVRLVDQDYAVFRKFQGRSSLATYLTTVISRIYLDFCVSRWGKWRPSAVARRLGASAVMLEQLIVRDGLTFEEAVSVMQLNHHFADTREELIALYAQLPARIGRRFANDNALVGPAPSAATDASLDRDEDQQIVERVDAALASALQSLSARDRLVLKLRFDDNLTIADIARLLNVPAKPLYRDLQATIAALREKLRQAGIDETDMNRIVGHPAVSLGRIFRIAGEADFGSV